MKNVNMKKLVAAFFLLTLLLTAACTTPSDHRCAQLPTGGAYCLQPTTTLPAFEGQQLVNTAYKEKKETLIVEIESDASGLRFAGLTPLGHKVLHITYNNLETQALRTPDQRLNPVLMVALLQLTLWPADTVQKGLTAPLKIEETEIEKSHHTRRILNGRDVVLTLHRHGDEPPYRHLQMNIPSIALDLDITTLEPAPSMKKKP